MSAVTRIGQKSIEPGITLLTVSGAADRPSSAALREALERALAPPGGRVILDLSEASFLDATMLRSLFAAYRSNDGDGTVKMAILCPQESEVRAMFAITALDTEIPVRDTQQEARAALDLV